MPETPSPSTNPQPPDANIDGNLNNTNSTVNSQNSTVNNQKTYQGAGSAGGMPSSSAISPSLMSTGSESCLYSSSAAFQTHMLGMSRGQYVSDPECERRRDAKVLADLQMRVAAVARLCQSESVWKSMFISGTPCPLLRGGRLVVGKRAYLALKQNPNLYIPDYEEKMDWYNAILGIGKTNETNSKEDSGDDLTISERFRSSLRSDSE